MSASSPFAGKVLVLKTATAEAPAFARLGGEAALRARLAAAGAEISGRASSRVTHALLSDAFRAEETGAGTLKNRAWCADNREKIVFVSEDMALAWFAETELAERAGGGAGAGADASAAGAAAGGAE